MKFNKYKENYERPFISIVNQIGIGQYKKRNTCIIVYGNRKVGFGGDSGMPGVRSQYYE
jgi:hypothetical protein